MTRFSSHSRIAMVGAFAALTALGTLAATTSASATPFDCFICKHPGILKGAFGTPPSPPPVTINKYGNGWGYGAAALGGMAVGMIAAGAASGGGAYGGSYGGDCILARRQAVDEFGNLYVKRVRVCQ